MITPCQDEYNWLWMKLAAPELAVPEKPGTKPGEKKTHEEALHGHGCHVQAVRTHLASLVW